MIMKMAISRIQWKFLEQTTELGGFLETHNATYVFLILRTFDNDREKMIALQNVYIKRYVPSSWMVQFGKELHLKETDQTARMTVYKNSRLVQQCKHICCDCSLALHFMIIKELISLNNFYEVRFLPNVIFMHR